ncbi:hypothetical protein BZG36_00893 [Bifiguratus adelaidae]|uniref:EF-hand domain-containing protein n=1 Tax=Bifiguratus adelaidae TaxID=1938954 RepID=A0A261Y5L5_9FUNG|nr:hypothetical protein BZG36_00893 [Bifiguratus adelaidae]
MALVLGLLVASASAGPSHRPRYQSPDHSNYGQKETQRSHIEEHLKELGSDIPADMTAKDEMIYVFTLHDYDKDGHLDGHELRAAFTDFDGINAADLLNLEEVNEMVDHVLEEDDINGDGKISWEEYIASQLYHES